MHYIIYKTTNNCNGKYYIGQHITDNLDDGYIGSGVALSNAIKKYGRDNFTRVILCYGDSQEDLNELEELAVDMSVVNDPMSYNLMTGGGSCGKRGKETRKKMSEANKNRSPESRQKMSEANKNRSPEIYKKISESNKGKVMSPGARQKISEAKKGKPSPFKGKKMSPESRQKISDAAKNRSPETRQKMSESHKGKTLSPKTKQKVCEAMKKYWQEKRTLNSSL